MSTQCSDDLDSLRYSTETEVDIIDEELLSSLNSLLISVSLPRIHHILDATPNLLIALYESLFKRRIPEVDRSKDSYASIASRIKNVKLLIGTIAHEALIGVDSEIDLSEIDPRRFCEKDVNHVRDLLWVMVTIGQAKVTGSEVEKNTLSCDSPPNKTIITPLITRASRKSQLQKDNEDTDSTADSGRWSGLKESGVELSPPKQRETHLRFGEDSTHSVSGLGTEFASHDQGFVEGSLLSTVPTSQIFSTPTKPIARSLTASYLCTTPKARYCREHSSTLAPTSIHSAFTMRVPPYESPLAKATSLRRNLLAASKTAPRSRQPVSFEDYSLVSTAYLDKISAKVIEISNRMDKFKKISDTTVPGQTGNTAFDNGVDEIPVFKRMKSGDKKVGIWLQEQNITQQRQGNSKERRIKRHRCAQVSEDSSVDQEERILDPEISPSPVRIRPPSMNLQPAETPFFSRPSNLKYDSGISMLSPESAFSLSPVRSRGGSSIRQRAGITPNRVYEASGPEKPGQKGNSPAPTRLDGALSFPERGVTEYALSDDSPTDINFMCDERIVIPSRPPSLPQFSPVSEFTIDFGFDIKTEELTRKVITPKISSPIPYYKLEVEERAMTERVDINNMEMRTKELCAIEILCGNEQDKHIEDGEISADEIQERQGGIRHDEISIVEDENMRIQSATSTRDKTPVDGNLKQSQAVEEPACNPLLAESQLNMLAQKQIHIDNAHKNVQLEETVGFQEGRNIPGARQINSITSDDDRSVAMDLTSPLPTPIHTPCHQQTVSTISPQQLNLSSSSCVPAISTFQSPLPNLCILGSSTRKPLCAINLITEAKLYSRKSPFIPAHTSSCESSEEATEMSMSSPSLLSPLVSVEECDIESTSNCWKFNTKAIEEERTEKEDMESEDGNMSWGKQEQLYVEEDPFLSYTMDRSVGECGQHTGIGMDDNTTLSHSYGREDTDYDYRRLASSHKLHANSPVRLSRKIASGVELTHPIPTPLPQQITLSQLLESWQLEDANFEKDAISSSGISTVTWGSDSTSVRNLRVQRKEALKKLYDMERSEMEQRSRNENSLEILGANSGNAMVTSAVPVKTVIATKHLQPLSTPLSKLGGRSYITPRSRNGRVMITAALSKRSRSPLSQTNAGIGMEISSVNISPVPLKDSTSSGNSQENVSRPKLDKENLFLPTIPTFDVDRLNILGSISPQGRETEVEEKELEELKTIEFLARKEREKRDQLLRKAREKQYSILRGKEKGKGKAAQWESKY